MCTHCMRPVYSGAYIFSCLDCDRDLCPKCFDDPQARNSKVKGGAKDRSNGTTKAEKNSSGESLVDSIMQTRGASRECKEGLHQFKYYPACRSLACSMCSQQIPSGTYVHCCDECDTDLCDMCFASAKKFTSRVCNVTTASKKVLNQSLLKDADVQDSSVECRPSEDSRSTASTASRSSSGEKQCKLCRIPYTGFGTTCSTCRKFGATVQHCPVCAHYFNGFGASCPECLSV